ncbi:unnamed protein product [Meloidogyne enterolobii]|uniref:Uncharacterized protein n=1 Tax=Meloidogyne enterolobii TaxID=390850 RepID=A0ACB0YTT3_MELEN
MIMNLMTARIVIKGKLHASKHEFQAIVETYFKFLKKRFLLLFNIKLIIFKLAFHSV